MTKKLSSSQIWFIEKFKTTDSVYVSDPIVKRTVNVLYNNKIVSSFGGDWWHLTDFGKKALKMLTE